MTASKSSTSALGHNVKKPAIFIDGEAGTTGLEIRQRLAGVDSVVVTSIAPEHRKDAKARQALMRQVDLVVLCLPDDAAKAAVALANDLGAGAPRIVDASTAHRVDPAWVYGFPEMNQGHAARVAAARRVSNPGCYPTGAIALLRPLIDAGLMAADHPVTVNAVSGYSGGGRQMIEAFEAGKAPSFELYGLGLQHKHLPELELYSGLTRRPIFVPSVGNFRQGMLVSIPLHLDALPGKPDLTAIEKTLAAHYKGSIRVSVIEGAASKFTRLEPEALNNSDTLELYVFGNDAKHQALLVARLDNLGKGAAGAAVQNLQLMLGLA